jgi:hypothetical protein
MNFRILPAVAFVAVLALSACTSTKAATPLLPPTKPAPPPLRVVSLGYDTISDPSVDLAGLDAKLRGAGVNGVAINAGRLDWTTFPWPGHQDQWSGPVQDGNVDLFGNAVRALGPGRNVSAVIDFFAPRFVASHPELAARDAHGQASEYQVSLTALAEGPAGAAFIDMIDHLASTYPIDAIELTELYYDSYSFGADDLRSYEAATGRSDWPRRNGEIDTSDPSIGTWRSQEVAKFIAQATAVAHRHGKQLLVDVRVSSDDLSRNSRENGQDYEMLLAVADRLVVWDYFGLSTDLNASFTSKLVDHLAKLGSDRFIVSVGLWSTQGVLPASELRDALALLNGRQVAGALVTPVSSFDASHWQALTELWSSG